MICWRETSALQPASCLGGHKHYLLCHVQQFTVMVVVSVMSRSVE